MAGGDPAGHVTHPLRDRPSRGGVLLPLKSEGGSAAQRHLGARRRDEGLTGVARPGGPARLGGHVEAPAVGAALETAYRRFLVALGDAPRVREGRGRVGLQGGGVAPKGYQRRPPPPPSRRPPPPPPSRRPPPPPPKPPRPPPEAPRSWASFTVSVRPPRELLLSALMAAWASSSVAISTKPKP